MVGHKKRFTFYEVDDDKRHKRTDWIMHEYTLDVSTLDGKRMLEEYVLCKLYNKKKSSSDSPNVRSDPPCPSSPDITSSRVQRRDEFYNDNGFSFVSQSNNVDTPKVVWEAVTCLDVLMINKDNQVQHSAQLSGANPSSAPYCSTQDMSSLGIFQKEVEHCNGAANSVLPQFSHGMPSPYTSQVMEVDQTMMNFDPLMQNPFQLSDAELSSAAYPSSQNMASLEMHPATPYCNQAIPPTTQWDSQLVQFPMMQLENTPQGNIPSHTFTRQEELDGLKSIMNEGHPQQRTPQQQEDMPLPYMSYPND